MVNERIFKYLKIAQLIILKRTNKITADQEAELSEWVSLSEKNSKLYTDLHPGGDLSTALQRLDKYDANVAFAEFESKITVPRGKLKSNRHVYLLMGIAASVLILAIGIWSYYSYNKSTSQLADLNDKHIVQGSKQATLILADGKKISLSGAANVELTTEGDVKVNKTKDGELVYAPSGTSIDKIAYNTVQTPRGGEYRINLPDGTKVWLNAASTLKYPTNFIGLKERRIELSGEAYFEVAKQYQIVNGKATGHRVSFIVSTIKQNIEVLGTHFNVNSYADEPFVKTTLIEGRVKVSIPQTSKAVVLLSGFESVVGGNQAIAVDKVDIDEAVAWKNGEFLFHEEDLGTIMRKLSRWYNVEVVFLDEEKRNVTFGGTISKFNRISKVLRMLEQTGLAKFKIEGNKVIVK